MTARITQTYRRIENALLTALALAWFGLLGDPDFTATAPAERSLPDSRGPATRA